MGTIIVPSTNFHIWCSLTASKVRKFSNCKPNVRQTDKILCTKSKSFLEKNFHFGFSRGIIAFKSVLFLPLLTKFTVTSFICRHLAYFITCKPTARLLSQLYFTKAATKVLEMRPDTLAQMLTWANIKNGSNVLLAETCQGLVLGSILERLGDKGQIVQAYPGNFPVRIILDQFNFPEEKKSKQICGFSLESLEEIKLSQGNDVVEITDPIEGEEKMDGLVVKEEIDEVEMSDKGETVKSDFETLDNAKEDSSFNNQENVPCNKYYTKEKREGEEKRALVYLKQKNLDALIIATKHHPLSLMLELLEYIKPSSPIIIYCQYKEPLMECYKYLRDESLAINVNLTETWFRDMQVLPNRTHPVITMSARSGYILRALKTKKENSEVVGDSEPAAKKPKL